MKNKFLFILACCLAVFSSLAQADKPLRIYIRAGAKTHGPGQHDHPQFLKDWKPLLESRGAKVEGSLNFPSPGELENSDVLIIFDQNGATITAEQKPSLEKFLQRGGGIVVLHDGICGKEPAYFKTIAGGAWEHGKDKSKYFEGDIAYYFQDSEHPITKGVANWDCEDEIYWDLQMMPEAHILAASYAPDKRNSKEGKILPSVYDIVPQMWTYERDNFRAFVSLIGHNYKSFNLPQYRAVLMRGIAWAGKRDIDSLVSKEELASLRYHEGGPTAPEKSAAQIKVHSDFNVNLAAAEPLIEKPISIDWDAQGRMWVAETPEYPAGRKVAPGGPVDRKDGKKIKTDVEDRPARDRISILEDTNGDGVMDKKTVFYDGLELVTSLVFYKDGVIVSQAPDIYWLRDTNHDGIAETKTLLYTGFGTMDTHAVLSNMRWGLDSWIYATLGYSGGKIKSADGQTDFGSLNSAVIRFKPDGSGMEQVSSKGGNTWGMDFAWDGELFFSQANCSHVDHVVVPENTLSRGKVGNTTSFKDIADHDRSFPIRSYEKQAYVQIDCVGGFTAASGCCIYNGGAWPEKYNYTHYVTEPTVNLVHQDFLKPDGVTFVASKDPEHAKDEFVAGNDLWFRPIHVRVGPDGAMYILDFYNQAAVHNDTRGPKHGPNNAAVRPDRDHYFGRVWRVQHKDAKKFEMPNLAKASPAELVKALEHPNEFVRMTAHRLLMENENADAIPALQTLATRFDKSAEARVHALWILGKKAALNEKLISTLMSDTSPALRKNAFRVASETVQPGISPPQLILAILQHLNEPDARVRLAALQALGYFPLEKQVAQMLIASYPSLNDQWSQSAAIGLTARNPFVFLEALLEFNNPAIVKNFAAELSKQIATPQNAAWAEQTVRTLAAKTQGSDELKQIVLENLAKNLNATVIPDWNAALEGALKALLGSANSGVASAAVPLASRWDKKGALAAELKTLQNQLMAKLDEANQTDDQRAQIIASLLSLRKSNAAILPSVAKILGSNSSGSLQKQVVQSLGNTGESAVGNIFSDAYAKVSTELQSAIFAQTIKRGDWSLAFLDAVKEGKISSASLSADSVHRLRTHADLAVSKRAAEIFDSARPEAKEKNSLIAKLTPVVTQPGKAANGRRLFLQNCGVCHKFNGEGKDVGPNLTGMGAHGPAELLVHVLDPNRVVEPNFVATSIESNDGETVDGIVARENKDAVVIKNASGEFEVPRQKIKSQRSTGRSLMPEGFEALGGESLRDILAYLCANDSRYRVIDLTSVATADTRHGLYESVDHSDETLKFKKFGLQKFGKIPFQILDPARSGTGKNIIVLKGGSGFAKTLPQEVEISNLVFNAGRLHFFAAAGWGWPWGGSDNEDLPVAKVIVRFTDNQSTEFTLKNGREFADYNATNDVPDSTAVPNLVEHGQVRHFEKWITHKAPIQKIILQSLDTAVAPTFVAITAEAEPEIPAGKNASGAPAEPTKFPWGKGLRPFMVGGGASHDFEKWFNACDSSTIGLGIMSSLNYTDQLKMVLPTLPEIDVLYLCANQPINDPALRKGIFDFADQGKGLLLMHPALWYNWKDWPDYNRVLVGGGARSHDQYGEFEVTVIRPDHPVMDGVPKTFKVKDELYHFEIDPKGTPIEVLATGKNAAGVVYPVVWTTQHPMARIVCVTLGHDGATHTAEPYKSMLVNAVIWTAGKTKPLEN